MSRLLQGTRSNRETDGRLRLWRSAVSDLTRPSAQRHEPDAHGLGSNCVSGSRLSTVPPRVPQAPSLLRHTGQVLRRHSAYADTGSRALNCQTARPSGYNDTNRQLRTNFSNSPLLVSSQPRDH